MAAPARAEDLAWGSGVKRVLMVDDSVTMRLMLRQTVEGPWPTAEITETGSTEEAEAYLATQDTPMDLILLDCNLPGSNGLALLDHLAQNDTHQGTPVVMVSAETENTVVISALRKGARGYLTKPFDEEKLNRLLKEHLGPPAGETDEKDKAGAS